MCKDERGKKGWGRAKKDEQQPQLKEEEDVDWDEVDEEEKKRIRQMVKRFLAKLDKWSKSPS